MSLFFLCLQGNFINLRNSVNSKISMLNFYYEKCNLQGINLGH